MPPLIPGQRDEVVLSRAVLAQFGGARVLITGAAGALGSAVARRLLPVQPAALFLLDRDADAVRALAAQFGGPAVPAPADIRDPGTLEDLLRQAGPDIVVHAAALGATAGLESMPGDAVWTNVRGTQKVARAAAEAGVGLLVHASAEEAGRPASVHGVSKRLAELVVAGFGQDPAGMRTMSVRIGPLLDGPHGLLHALASHGLTGRPVTLRNPDDTCPVVTAADAAGLVLEAAALRGPYRTYVLDPGDHVAVVEFARYLAGRVGLPEPEFDVAEEAAGPPAGTADRATVRRTSHPRVWSLPPDEVDTFVAARLEGLASLAGATDGTGAAELRAGLISTLAACSRTGATTG